MKSAKAAIAAHQERHLVPRSRERAENRTSSPSCLRRWRSSRRRRRQLVAPSARPSSRSSVVALIWATFGHVDIVASASGKVVPSGRVKLIQPFETGVVRAIHVRDGQSVKAGDVLIELDPSMTAAERAQKEAERDTIAAVIDKLEAAEPIIAQRVDIRKTLVDKELGSKLTYLETLQQLTENHKDTAIQKSRLAEANAAVAAITARMKRQILTAPVDGVVQQLAVHTVGGVVTPAQQLAVVVPSDVVLEIEAMVLESRDRLCSRWPRCPDQDRHVQLHTVWPSSRPGFECISGCDCARRPARQDKRQYTECGKHQQRAQRPRTQLRGACVARCGHKFR